VLSEAGRIRERLGADLSLIYIGERNDETSKKFQDILGRLELPGRFTEPLVDLADLVTRARTGVPRDGYYREMLYRPDLEAALQDLRQREFEAGRYNPAQPFPRFPIRPDAPAPGPQHESIYEAIEDAAEEGTRSILDIETVSEWPDFGVASPLSEQDLERYFGTKQPTKEMVSRKLDFLSSMERGHCVYMTVFASGRPSELFFGGYSFD